ncbi:MAG TPA: glyceraldehyde-3-phosphate dehydrogenase, partial [Syntrophobacteraceae bacterium]|nr:glyceraldehyde-3-phosphate dehydrogenase [Syntrophobacteraceae bacterium]
KAVDLRKTRSVMNNIILTTTGAANALALVIPEMKRIGFIAESVRIPTTTGSLIILVALIQDESLRHPTSRETINGVYREAIKHFPEGYLLYTEEQNVSSDIIGMPRAAAVIEGHETHTRTTAVRLDFRRIAALCSFTAGGGPLENAGSEASVGSLTGSALADQVVEIPVTQAVIYGWDDNELGSYTNML